MRIRRDLFVAVAALGLSIFAPEAKAQTTPPQSVQIEFRGGLYLNAYRTTDNKQTMSVGTDTPGSFWLGGGVDQTLVTQARSIRVDLPETDTGEVSNSCREMLNGQLEAVRSLTALGKTYTGSVMIAGTTRAVNFNKSLKLIEIRIERLNGCSRD